MTIYNQIHQLYLNALLADAAYVGDLSSNDSNADLRRKLKERLTATLAAYVADGFAVLDQNTDASGFSGTIFQDRQTGQIYFAMRGTETGDFGDVVADVDLAVGGGVAAKQIIAMVNWYLRSTTASELVAPQIEIADYSQFEAYLTGGLPAIDDVFSSSIRLKAGGAPGLAEPGGPLAPLLDPATNIIVTGHSLGGNLTTALARLFDDRVSSSVTFNGAGFLDRAEYFFDRLETVLGLPTTSYPEATQTNVFAQHGVNVTANDYYHAQYGDRVAVFNEDTIGVDAYRNHLMYKLTDALALYDAVASLDHNLTMQDIAAILNSASTASDDSLERILDDLRELFLGESASTPVGDIDGAEAARVAFHTNLAQLCDDARFTSQFGKLDILSLAGLGQEDIVDMANADVAVRYALTNMNAFVVGGDAGLYASHNQSGELDLYDESTGAGTLTQQNLRDRAAFLTTAIQENQQDDVTPNVAFMSSEDRRFIDRDSGTSIAVVRQGDPSRPLPETALTVFGGSDDDEGAAALQGSAFSDHLYGEGGNDEVHGQGGDDYLEGGQGNDQLFGEAANDTLVGGVGNDELTGGAGSDRLEGGRGVDTYQFSALDLRDSSTDTIRDVDGQGVIKIDGVALNAAGAKALSPNTWDLQDGTRVFLISNQASDGVPSDTLLIKKPGHDGSYIKIENFHQGDFGLTLPDFLQGQRAINSDLSTAADYAVLQSAANINLDLSSGVRNQLIAGSSGSGPQSYSALSATQADALLDKYAIVYQYANDESGFSATVFKDNVTGQFVLSFRGMEFEPNRVDAYAKDTKLGALRDINREGFAFGQIMSMERVTGHLLNGETLNRVTGEWEPNAALQNFSAEAYGGRLIVTGADIGGHLATAFTLLNSGLVERTYSFDGIGLGAINGGEPTAEKLGALLDQFRAMMSYRGEAVQSPFWDEINAAGLGENYKLALEADKGDATLTLTSQLYYTPYGPAGIIGGDPIIQANPTNGYENVNIYKSQLYQFVANYLGRETNGAGQGNTGAFGDDGLGDNQLIDAWANYQSSTHSQTGDNDPNAFDSTLYTLSSDKIVQINARSGFLDISEQVVRSGYQAPKLDLWVEDQAGLRVSDTATAQDVSSALYKAWSGDAGNTNSLTRLTDSLTVYQLLQQLDPAFTPDQHARIQQAIANNTQAATSATLPGGKVAVDGTVQDNDALENTVEALSRLFLGNSAELAVNNGTNGYIDQTNRDALHQRITQVKSAITAANSPTAQLAIIDLSTVSVGELIARASQNNSEGLAYRYALAQRNPFVVLDTGGGIYSAQASDPAYQLYDPVTGSGDLTMDWLFDRAAYVKGKLEVDTLNLQGDDLKRVPDLNDLTLGGGPVRTTRCIDEKHHRRPFLQRAHAGKQEQRIAA